MKLSLNETVQFEEVRWLQTLRSKTRNGEPPARVESTLLKRGLIERKSGILELTPRGRIALAKLA